MWWYREYLQQERGDKGLMNHSYVAVQGVPAAGTWRQRVNEPQLCGGTGSSWIQGLNVVDLYVIYID